MKVLFVSSEVDPLAKTGGLADVASSLPKALKKLGVDVRIIIPYYNKFVEGKGFEFEKTNIRFSINLDGIPREGEYFKTELVQDLPVYLLRNDDFFDRENLYGTPEGDYSDNHLRFAFLDYGVFEFIKHSGFIPDVIHINDWQTGLIPLLRLKKYYGINSKILLTIHNLAYQGLFPREILSEIGLNMDVFHVEGVEFYGKVNFLKAGIVYSDAINTVSPTYAKEIQTEEYGHGLEGILRKRQDRLYGILNGLDYEVWDPATDKDIYFNYSAENALEGKRKNKEELLKETGLKGGEKPLVGIVSRLAQQKGFDLFPEIMENLLKLDLNMIVLGSGDKTYQEMFEDFSRKFGSLYVKIGFDPVLARKIYAGCDMFLMPSRYEPCGLGQLISMRYGTVPVVRKTGGLKDTVVDVEQGGYGFVFEEYSPRKFFDTVSRAVNFYYSNRKEWANIVRKIMQLDFSWSASANKYLNLYRELI